jgi:cytochrome c553
MKKTLLATTLLAVLPAAVAADLEAGRAKVAAVCAACHGANGVSVSEAIPNLAAQRAGYLEAQLKALKAGTRKNDIMNAMAAQLSPEDIANVAAFFASLPGAGTAAKSDFMPQVVKSGVTFPEGFPSGFVKYHTINFPDRKQVQHFYANAAAVEAARAGKPLPDGSTIVGEMHAAKLGADGKPVTGKDGFIEADKVLFYAAMARGPGWGKDIPEMLRNGDWNYAVFTPARQVRPGVNQAECLACHKPLEAQAYAFTFKELAASR